MHRRHPHTMGDDDCAWFGLIPSMARVVGSVLAEKGGGSVENEGVRVEEH